MIYQGNRFKSLMDGYSRSIELYNGALDSAGVANQKFAIYQESAGAKAEKLKASFEGLWQRTFNSTSFKIFLDGMSKLVDSVESLTQVITLLGGAIAVYKSGLLSSIPAIFGFTSATRAMGVAATTSSVAVSGFQKALGVFGLISMAIGVAITAFDIFTESAEETASKIAEVNNEVQKMDGNIESVNRLAKSFKELNDKASKTDLSTDEMEELRKIQNDLAELMPEVTAQYDAEGNAIIKNADILDKYIEKLKEERNLKASENRDTYLTQLEEEYKKREKTFDQIRKRNEEIVKWQSMGTSELQQYSVDRFTNKNDVEKFRQKLISNELLGIKKLNKELNIANSNISNMYENVLSGIPAFQQLEGVSKKIGEKIADNIFKKEFGSKLDFTNIQKFEDRITGIANILQNQQIQERLQQYQKLSIEFQQGKVPIDELSKSYNTLRQELLSLGIVSNDIEKFLTMVKEQAVVIPIVNLSNSISELKERTEDLSKAYDEMNENKSISVETMQKLIGKYPELQEHIKIEGDLITIDKNLLEQKWEIQQNLIAKEIEGSKKLLEAKKLEVEGKVRAYGIELMAFNELLKAYSLGEKAFADISNQIAITSLAKQGKEITSENMMDELQKIGEFSTQAKVTQEDLDKVTDSLNKLNSLKISSFGSSSKKKEKQEPDRAEVQSNEKLIEKELYSDVNNEIQKYNSLIGASEGIVKNTKDLKLQNSELKNQIDLYRGLQSAIHSKAEVARDERADIVGKLRGYGMGFQFTGTGDTMTLDNASTTIEKQRKIVNSLKDYKKNADKDIYMAQKQKLEDMERLSQRFFDIQNKDLFEYKNQWNDAFEKINSNFEKIKDNEIDILFEKPLANSERFDKNIERIKKHLSSLDENDFDAKAIYIGREIQANTTQIDQNKQAIKDLINTTDEKIKQDPKYLENLAKLETQTVNLRNANVDLNKELKNTAREAMQEELNARKENLDLLKQENEEKDRAKEREFQDREWAIEEKLVKLEKELYGGSKEDYESALTSENEKLKQKSEEMQKQEDSLSKQADLQKKLLDLEKARQDLANAQKERNVRMYTGKGFEWVANPKDIESAQEKVTSLQEDYDKIISDQAKETKKQQLQNEINANEKLIDEKNKAYEKQEKILTDSLNRDKKAYDKEKILRDRNIENTEIQLNRENQLIDTKLKELSVTYDNNWQTIIGIYEGKLQQAESIKAKMLEALTVQGSVSIASTISTPNVPTSNTSAPKATNISPKTNQSGTTYGNISGIVKNWTQQEIKDAAQAGLFIQKLDTGGYTGDNEGLAILHKKELILNPEDSKNILNAVYASRDFDRHMPNTTTTSNNTHEQQINYNFHNVKVVSDNAEQFWKNIEGYAIKRR